MKIVLCVVILFLAGCASTGVVQTGSDTFFIGKKDGTPNARAALTMHKRPNYCKGYYRALFTRKVALRQIPRQFSQLSLTLWR